MMEELKRSDYITASMLSERLEISRRTVIRDIQILKDAGYNVSSSIKGYHLNKGDKLSFSLTLSGEEKFTMLAGLQMLFDTKDPSLQAISQRLMYSLFGYDKKMKLSNIFIQSSKNENLMSLVRRIRAAVDNRKMIRFEYDKPDTDKLQKREVWPLAVFFRRHSYYMVARCTTRESLRLFRVSRIDNMRMTRKSFPIQDFSLEDYLASTFELDSSGQIMDVQVHFRPRVAPYITELVWHPTQVIKHLKDDSLILNMTVTVNQEIVRWILGFGSECKVLAPQVLINMIKEHLIAMKSIYNL